MQCELNWFWDYACSACVLVFVVPFRAGVVWDRCGFVGSDVLGLFCLFLFGLGLRGFVASMLSGLLFCEMGGCSLVWCLGFNEFVVA